MVGAWSPAPRNLLSHKTLKSEHQEEDRHHLEVPPLHGAASAAGRRRRPRRGRMMGYRAACFLTSRVEALNRPPVETTGSDRADKVCHGKYRRSNSACAPLLKAVASLLAVGFELSRQAVGHALLVCEVTRLHLDAVEGIPAMRSSKPSPARVGWRRRPPRGLRQAQHGFRIAARRKPPRPPDRGRR